MQERQVHIGGVKGPKWEREPRRWASQLEEGEERTQKRMVTMSAARVTESQQKQDDPEIEGRGEGFSPKRRHG